MIRPGAELEADACSGFPDDRISWPRPGADQAWSPRRPTPGLPGLRALVPRSPGRLPDWTGYLSTTGVYGDRHRRWVRGEPALAQSVEGAPGRRRAGLAGGRPRHGPDRGHRLRASTARPLGLDRLRAGEARRIRARAGVLRIHVDDLAAGLGPP